MMISDFHSHILPGIDDGSSSCEESIAMLRMEAEQGIRHVVATPHFYARYDNPEEFLRKRARAEKMLREEMAKEKGLPEVSIGSEVHFFNGIGDSDVVPRLTIGSKRCILIEMPHTPWTPAMYRELENISLKQDLIPIVAHMDRYISPFRTYNIPEYLADLPVLVQANADFFLKRSTAAMAMRMLKAGQIHLLGSDCHNLTSRKPNLGEAVSRIQQKLGREALDRISVNEQVVLGLDDAQRKGMV